MDESDARHHRLESDEEELTDSRFGRGARSDGRRLQGDRMQEVELQDRDADTVSPSLLAHQHHPDADASSGPQFPSRNQPQSSQRSILRESAFCSRLTRQQRLVVGIVLAVVLFIVLVFLVRAWYARDDGADNSTSNSQPSYPAATAADIEHCIKSNRLAYNPTQPGLGRSPLCTAQSSLCDYSGSVYPPFFSSSANGNLMITHATVLDGKGNTFSDYDIQIKNGVIINMGSGLPSPHGSDGYTILDVGGAFVTPGLVDMHSHIGVYPWPEGLAGNDDGNEMTNPTYPQMRVIDAFDPEDWAIPSIMRMGITTSQVLPGSGNLMGGEGGVFKLRGHTIQEMFVENSPRILKMACGENPKRVYGSKGQTPMSRMGNAWLFRSKIDQARRVQVSQYDWCAANANNPSPSTRFPYDLSVEGLVSLLRAEARLNVHCYEVHDLEMMLRLSREFNFTIAAFHHALEAYKVAPYLKERNITVATFSDLWGYKKEGYDGSTLGPSRLDAFGVPVAIKSDHPVIFAADLMYEAAKAHHYGLSANRALAAVTSVPAAAIGMADKIGSLAVGLDGDVVVWDRDPLTLGARPRHVAINGVLQHSNTASVPVMSGSSSAAPDATLVPPTTPPICPAGSDLGPQHLSAGYALTGATVLSVSGSGALTNLTNAVIVVDGSGTIICMKGGFVDSTTPCPIASGVPVFGLSGGWVIPGMIDAGSRVGQQEIGQEGSTQDGEISGSGADGSSLSVQACDGIRLFGAPRHIRAAWAGGITSSIVRPMGSQLIQGTSCAYHTCYNCTSELSDPLYSLASELAVHVTVGQDTKSGGGMAASLSGQLAALRSFIRSGAVGNATVIAEASSADAIEAVLRLQKALGFKLVIMGGAEAVVHKEALASQQVGVLLTTRVPPSTFNTVHARWDAMAQLQAAGVSPLAMFVGDLDNGRNLRFEAGIAVEYGLPWKDALAAVTSQVAKVFGLTAPSAFTHTGELVEGKFANFVAFDGNPFSLQSRVQLIGLGTWANCQPRQL